MAQPQVYPQKHLSPASTTRAPVIQPKVQNQGAAFTTATQRSASGAPNQTQMLKMQTGNYKPPMMPPGAASSRATGLSKKFCFFVVPSLKNSSCGNEYYLVV